ncbi:MAG: YaiO family outer membrane beta-barrel protein [Nitrospirae bacterium]|nr:YaiO family outer membrane beta-barrel protein [Nitrospirota bacterium]
MSKMAASRISLLLTMAGIFVFLMNFSVSAQEGEEKNRIEINLTYEHLTPNEIYGDWKNLSLAYYRTPKSDFSYFLQAEAFSRKEGDGVLGVIGAYKDWMEYLYTYSSVSAGSNSEYLPMFRGDHDFNLKLGEDRNIVWITGITYIKYFDVHKDLILSTGLALYYPADWIWMYRIFINDSDPGNMISYSHLFSVGYGREKWQWTYLNISFGKQAYLATYLQSPEEVNRDTFRIALKHRLWLNKDYGIMAEASYLKLDEEYEKYGFSLGFFKEF